MYLAKPTKSSWIVALSIIVLGVALWSVHSAGAQQGAVITIDGQTTCTDQGVTASIEVVNPAPGFTVYFDVSLGDEVQYSEELATGQRESFVFTLPRQDFPATVSEGVMTAFSSDPDDEGESLPVAYRWPAVSCGSTPTTTIEEVPTTVASVVIESTTTSSTSSTTIHESTTTTIASTTTAPVALDEVGIIDAVTEERIASDASLTDQTASSTDALAYTGASTGQIALIFIAFGAVFLGAGCIITRPRPLRR